MDPGDPGELVGPGELGVPPPVGGAVVGGALVDGVELDVGPLKPCNVTTAPPGENVTVLVHDPAGAALVAVAMIA